MRTAIPWLETLRRDVVAPSLETGKPAILACSALKAAYLERLGAADPRVRVICLKGDFKLIRERMERRARAFHGRGHAREPVRGAGGAGQCPGDRRRQSASSDRGRDHPAYRFAAKPVTGASSANRSPEWKLRSISSSPRPTAAVVMKSVGKSRASECAAGRALHRHRHSQHLPARGVEADDAPAIPHRRPEASFAVHRQPVGKERLAAQVHQDAAIPEPTARRFEVVGVDDLRGRIGEVERPAIRTPAEAVRHGQAGFHHLQRTIRVVAVERRIGSRPWTSCRTRMRPCASHLPSLQRTCERVSNSRIGVTAPVRVSSQASW